MKYGNSIVSSLNCFTRTAVNTTVKPWDRISIYSIFCFTAAKEHHKSRQNWDEKVEEIQTEILLVSLEIDMIRWLLREYRQAGSVEYLGCGPDARWYRYRYNTL